MTTSPQLLGIDLGGTKCMFGFQHNDEKRIFKKYPTGVQYTKETFLQHLKDFSLHIQHKLNQSTQHSIHYIVISICGLVDTDGIIGLCELPKLTGTNIKHVVSAQFNVSVDCISTVNDAYAALHAALELYPHEQNMAVVVCGTDIGSAFIIDGTILECNDCIAGWVGGCPVTVMHHKLNKRETKTLDDVCGGRAIMNSLSSLSISADDVANNRIDDEKDRENVQKILKDAGYYMGVGVCICLNMMKCRRIVFAGGVFNFPYFHDAMMQSVHENMLIKEVAENCKMGICKQYNELVCVGTLVLAKSNSELVHAKMMHSVGSGGNRAVVIIDELLVSLSSFGVL